MRLPRDEAPAPAWLAALAWPRGASAAREEGSAPGGRADGSGGRSGARACGTRESAANPEFTCPPVVSPAWEPVAAGSARAAEWGACPLPNLRFFLRSADELSKVYMPA